MGQNILRNIYLFSAMQGVFLLLILLLNKKIKANKVLLPYFIIFKISGYIGAYFDAQQNMEIGDWFHGTADIFYFFLGPYILFYIYYVTGSLKKKNIILFLPPLPVFAAYLFFILSSNKYLELYVVCFTVISIMTLVYLIIAFSRLNNYRKQLSNNLTDIHKDIFKFFYLLIIVPFLSIVFSFLYFLPQFATFFLLLLPTVDFILSIFENFIVLMIFLIIVLKTDILYNTENMIEYFSSQMKRSESKREGTKKEYNLKLPESEAEIYLTKLLEFIKVNQPYKKQSYTLSQLSEDLEIPLHKLSRVINDRLNINFYTFINRYRIEEAKKLLINMDLEKTNIINIAFESGFNSKTTFNTVFKKFTGLTPTEYINKKENI